MDSEGSLFPSDKRASPNQRRFSGVGALALAMGVLGPACSEVVDDQSGGTSMTQPQSDGGMDAAIDGGLSDASDAPDSAVDAADHCLPHPPLSDLDVRRAKTAKLLVEAAGLKIDAPETPTFEDVPISTPFYPFIMTAAKHDIMPGYKNADGSLTGCWGPLDEVSRQDFARMLVDTFGLQTNTQGGPHFPDVTPDMWVYPYVETLYHWSVTEGDPDGLFRPQKDVPKVEAYSEVVKAQSPKPKN